MERRVRGSVINAYIKYIRTKWGTQGELQFYDETGMDEDFKDGMYYHDELRENILRWIGRIKGPQYIEEAGKYVVSNLGILSWLVRFASIKTLANKFPKNYSEVYTFGKVKVEFPDDRTVNLKLYEVNRIKESCTSWIGVCRAALELTNTKGTVTETKCAVDGDEYCQYVMKY